MSLCPSARSHEFRRPLDLAGLRPGDVLVDFPSAGSYLQPDLDEICPSAVLRAVEHVQGYIDHDGTILGGNWQHLPFDDGTVDVVLTLAAIHHVLSGREEFYRECHRVLSAEGRLVIADVAEQTPAAAFLSEFVHRHGHEGHFADFLSHATEVPRIEGAGFDVVHYEVESFHWTYPDRETAIRFCRGLFRLDLATDDQILRGLTEYLGFEEAPAGARMNWQLAFVRANRRATA